MIRVGAYRLLERIGGGGMAEVWTAVRDGETRPLALKRMLPHLAADPRIAEMFAHEARLSARLHHEHIIEIQETGDSYLAMELVVGRTLLELMRTGPLPPPVVAYIVAKICRALAYAHQLRDEAGVPLGVIHRDVTPSNVMIGFAGEVKLFDFGIAKILAGSGAPRTATGVRKGKAGYLAPEQRAGRDIDRRVDVFAAGIVLHEALTGRRLFGDGDAEITPPSAHALAVPPELDRICLRALARDREQRYADCDQMVEPLERLARGFDAASLAELMSTRFAHGDEPTAPTVSPHKRQRPTLAIAAALLLTCGAGVAIWRTLRRTQPAEAPPPIATAQPVDTAPRPIEAPPPVEPLPPIATTTPPAEPPPPPPAAHKHAPRLRKSAAAPATKSDGLRPRDVFDPWK